MDCLHAACKLALRILPQALRLPDLSWPDVHAMQFTMPVEVNWSNMDTALMKRFWDARPPEEREGIADMSDRVLVFHRGITSVCLLLHHVHLCSSIAGPSAT